MRKTTCRQPRSRRLKPPMFRPARFRGRPAPLISTTRIVGTNRATTVTTTTAVRRRNVPDRGLALRAPVPSRKGRLRGRIEVEIIGTTKTETGGSGIALVINTTPGIGSVTTRIGITREGKTRTKRETDEGIVLYPGIDADDTVHL